jgi:ornithine decarboxylase
VALGLILGKDLKISHATLSILSRYIFSKAAAVKQARSWISHLPHISPFYAVKCNNDSRLLSWLHKEGVRFDCASPAEMKLALGTGARPNDIIYANPSKGPQDITAAQQLGVSMTVVDSPEEVIKLRNNGWKGSSMIRLLVPDGGSAQPFSKKFGAPLAWVPDILDCLKETCIPLAGWSFHVGSMCNDPKQFATAIELCATAHSLVPPSLVRHGQLTVDVGGGFLPDRDAFAAAAAEIRASQRLFPKGSNWIGEPGRFMASPVVSLEVPVIATKKRLDGHGFRYTLDESVYSAFSNIPFDGQKPTFDLVSGEPRQHVRATLFGRTCDSGDCIAEDIGIPELRVGDILRIPNMGAYTMVSGSEFNGFDAPKRVYMA